MSKKKSYYMNSEEMLYRTSGNTKDQIEMFNLLQDLKTNYHQVSHEEEMSDYGMVESTVYKLHNREYEVLSLHHPNNHITTTIKKLK